MGAYQVLDLTDDENKIIQFINKAQDTFGGDGDEFYELVIKKILIIHYSLLIIH